MRDDVVLIDDLGSVFERGNDVFLRQGSAGQNSAHQLLGDLVWPLRRRAALHPKTPHGIEGSQDVLVLTFNVDENPGVLRPFLDRIGATSLAVLPSHDFVSRQLEINGFPCTWIVDPDGIVRREQVGFTSEPEKWLQSVKELLSQDRR
jgi:hypothetical protein